jgi:hypothetical protein
MDGKLQDFPSKPALDEFRSPTVAGIFFGINWPWSKRTNLGIEARVFSENSGTIFLMYRF